MELLKIVVPGQSIKNRLRCYPTFLLSSAKYYNDIVILCMNLNDSSFLPKRKHVNSKCYQQLLGKQFIQGFFK